MKQPITIALSKGRLLPTSISLLKKIGVQSRDLNKDSRQLLFKATRDKINIMIVRAVDVPTYVEYGAADIGIAGKDILLEQDKDVYEPLDLKFGKCRIVLAKPANRSSNRATPWSRMRIATKYPVITERYFSGKGLPVEIIKLYGAIELAPGVGLAEQVVDLISSGRTLQENRLTIVEEIASSTARLIVNRASMKLKYERIRELIEKFRKVVKDRNEDD
jgi:ATP phosphoribosyltransferase